MANSVGPAGLPHRMQVEKTGEPLKIAVVYGRAPFPMARADQLTVSHLLAFLGARGHDVDLYALDAQGKLLPEHYEFLNDVCRNVNIYHQGAVHSFWGMFLGLFCGWPLQTGYFWNGRQARELRKAIDAGEYDVVYVYYMRSAPSVGERFVPNQPTERNGRLTAAFLAMQLSQSLNWQRMLDGCRSILRRPFYSFETSRVRRYEGTIWKKFTKVLLIGPKDVDAVSDACREIGERPLENWVYGAHGTNVDSFRPARPDEVVPQRLVFSGHMGVRTNVDGIVWFVTNCWDRVRERFPEAELYIVGRSPAEEVLALASPERRITVTGAVDDVGVYIRSAAVCVNPVHAAAGMQNKLLEFLASQRPIVCTPATNEGVLAPEDAVIVAPNADEFVEGVMKCLEDPAEADAMAARGREFVQQNWTWEAHFLKLEDDFRQALAATEASSGLVSSQ